MSERARWWLVKHVPCPRRNEPRNVGVLVHVGDAVAMRFLPTKRWPADPLFGAWIQEMRQNPDAPQRAGAPYYAEPAGERLMGETPPAEEFADQLFAELVVPPESDSRAPAALGKVYAVYAVNTGPRGTPGVPETCVQTIVATREEAEEVIRDNMGDLHEYVFDHCAILPITLGGPFCVVPERWYRWEAPEGDWGAGAWVESECPEGWERSALP